MNGYTGLTGFNELIKTLSSHPKKINDPMHNFESNHCKMSHKLYNTKKI